LLDTGAAIVARAAVISPFASLHVIALAIHCAKKLYLALRELVGDTQYQAISGEWITLATIKIALELQGAA